MRRLVDKARRNRETTSGEALLESLERRLDNSSSGSGWRRPGVRPVSS